MPGAARPCVPNNTQLQRIRTNLQAGLRLSRLSCLSHTDCLDPDSPSDLLKFIIKCKAQTPRPRIQDVPTAFRAQKPSPQLQRKWNLGRVNLFWVHTTAQPAPLAQAAFTIDFLNTASSRERCSLVMALPGPCERMQMHAIMLPCPPFGLPNHGRSPLLS